MKAPLHQNRQYLHSWKQVITNGIKANLRSRYGDLFGLVKGVCLLGPTIPWDTHWIREKVLEVTCVWAPLHLVNAF